MSAIAGAGEWGQLLPQPVLAKPKTAPIVAVGEHSIVLIDVTRPVSPSFLARVYDESVAPSPSDVVALYWVYGTSVERVVKTLDYLWMEHHWTPIQTFKKPLFCAWEHNTPLFEAVHQTITALAERFTP